MTLERSPLEDALGIPGARAVSLLAPDGPTVLWWGGIAPDEREAVAVVALSAAAAGLVAISEPGDELGDVLLTSSDAFHVVRLVPDGSARVAHLTLRRAGANLAMARHEFKALVDRYHSCPLDSQPRTTPAARPTPSAAPAAPPPTTGEESGEEADPAAPLPRRLRGELPEDTTTGGVLSPDWFSMLGHPYLTDDGVLDRILVTLRRL
jgi:hypothetical protein